MKKAIKVITIAAILAMATISYGTNYTLYPTPKEKEKIDKIRDALFQKYLEAKTPEEEKITHSALCIHDVFYLLINNKRKYAYYAAEAAKAEAKEENKAYFARFPADPPASEEEIKARGKELFMERYINTDSFASNRIAYIRGNYLFHLELERKRKLCHLNAYEKLTGTRIYR